MPLLFLTLDGFETMGIQNVIGKTETYKTDRIFQSTDKQASKKIYKTY